MNSPIYIASVVPEPARPSRAACPAPPPPVMGRLPACRALPTSGWKTVAWIAGGVVALGAAAFGALVMGLLLLVLLAAAASSDWPGYSGDMQSSSSSGGSFEDQMSGFMGASGGSYDSSTGSISY